jgi:hypothetical protein
MRDFHAIIIFLKRYISSDKKVYDKDVANVLNISQSQFATLKRRNSTPYIKVLEFCKNEDICANKVFFD